MVPSQRIIRTALEELARRATQTKSDPLGFAFQSSISAERQSYGGLGHEKQDLNGRESTESITPLQDPETGVINWGW